MKNKKLFVPAIILAVAILATAVYTVIDCLAFKPTVTEGEFPFSITYELDGKTVTMEDVYRARYVRNDGYADTKSRVYVGRIGDLDENQTVFTLKKDDSGTIELWTFFYPDYLMGDPDGDYFDDKPFAPHINYYDLNYEEHDDEQTLAAHGVKLISFEYPTPIENSFVFSHLSYCSGAVVLPILLIALLALLAMIIFVKKEKDLKYKAVDIVSIIFNFIIPVVYLPFVTVLSIFIDIEGGGPELYFQILYFIPWVSTLCLAASVALRRKGYAVRALITEFAGPAVFALYLVIFYFGELFS